MGASSVPDPEGFGGAIAPILSSINGILESSVFSRFGNPRRRRFPPPSGVGSDGKSGRVGHIAAA